LFLGQQLGLDANSDVVNHAIRRCGYVFVQPANSAIFVELNPSVVAPLAALEAFYEVKAAAMECVVLVSPGDTWRRRRYELFFPPEAALKRMESVARAASRRAAFKVQVGSLRHPRPAGVVPFLGPRLAESGRAIELSGTSAGGRHDPKDVLGSLLRAKDMMRIRLFWAL
jgi:hypothetical protein